MNTVNYKKDQLGKMVSWMQEWLECCRVISFFLIGFKASSTREDACIVLYIWPRASGLGPHRLWMNLELLFCWMTMISNWRLNWYLSTHRLVYISDHINFFLCTRWQLMQKLVGVERMFPGGAQPQMERFLSHFLPGSGTMPEEGMEDHRKQAFGRTATKQHLLDGQDCGTHKPRPYLRSHHT